MAATAPTMGGVRERGGVSHLGIPFGASIGGFSGSVEGAAIVATAGGAFQNRLVNQGQICSTNTTPIQTESRATRNGIWSTSLALLALSRNTELILAGSAGDHPAAGPGTAGYRVHQAGRMVANLAIGDRLVRKVDDGRRPKAIWEIPDRYALC